VDNNQCGCLVKKILTACPWRTGRDHQDALVLCRWRLSSKTWNPICYSLPEWSNHCSSESSTLETNVYVSCYTPSSACQKRRTSYPVYKSNM